MNRREVVCEMLRLAKELVARRGQTHFPAKGLGLCNCHENGKRLR